MIYCGSFLSIAAPRLRVFCSFIFGFVSGVFQLRAIPVFGFQFLIKGYVKSLPGCKKDWSWLPHSQAKAKRVTTGYLSESTLVSGDASRSISPFLQVFGIVCPLNLNLDLAQPGWSSGHPKETIFFKSNSLHLIWQTLLKKICCSNISKESVQQRQHPRRFPDKRIERNLHRFKEILSTQHKDYFSRTKIHASHILAMFLIMISAPKNR